MTEPTNKDKERAELMEIGCAANKCPNCNRWTNGLFCSLACALEWDKKKEAAK